MTVEVACSQQSRNRHTLRFPEAKPVLVFTDAGEAAIFAKATNGTSPPMANLTNLAKCFVGRGQVPLVHPKQQQDRQLVADQQRIPRIGDLGQPL